MNGIIGAIVIGGISGWLADKVMGDRFGLIGNIIVGVVGGMIGNKLIGPEVTRLLGYGTLSSIATAFLGAILLLLVINLLKGNRFRKI